jgi:N-acetylglucosaminyldiphosphoundecaprenol N-acetyl-beta-D-mannosaminyltransferase
MRLLGVRIDRLRLQQLLDRISIAMERGELLTVLYVNVHCMNVQHRDPAYGGILEAADLVYCDGTGVRLAAILARAPIPERMTGADWIDDLCRRAARNHFSLFLLGGTRGAADEAAHALTLRHPGLKIAGSASGFEAGSTIIELINRSGCGVLLVGMGTPTQERWIQQHRADLDVPVVWAVGALFDFVSGRLPRGPRFMTEHGFEWLCRLAVEPRKLWRRYLVGNPQFLWRVISTYRLRR